MCSKVNQMLTQMKCELYKLSELKSLSESVHKMQCFLTQNDSVLCEAIDAQNAVIFAMKWNCIDFMPKTRVQMMANTLDESTSKAFVCHFGDCGKSYAKSHELAKHMKSHINTVFVCDVDDCDEEFDSKQRLLRHKRSHLEFECYDCDQRFAEMSDLYRHRSTAHVTDNNGRKPVAKSCGQPSTSRQSKRSTAAKRFKCDDPNCGESFDRQLELNHHKSMHFTYVCGVNDCGKRFEKEFLLDRHLTNAHLSGDNGEPMDDSCGQSSASRQRMDSTDSMPFVCDWSDCGQTYKTSKSLDNHKSRAHMIAMQLKCDEQDCDKSFDAIWKMYKHKHFAHPNSTKHESNASQLDDICGQPSTSAQCMDRTDSKRFVCYWTDCGQTLKSSENLEKHINAVHLKPKQLKCVEPNCLRSFDKKWQMYRHKGIDHKNSGPNDRTVAHKSANRMKAMRLVCDEHNCGKKFFSSEALAKHELFHTSNKIFCLYKNCNQSFDNWSQLWAHNKYHKTNRFRRFKPKRVKTSPKVSKPIETVVKPVVKPKKIQL